MTWFKDNFVALSFIFVLVVFRQCTTNEITRCCAGGSRHYREHSSCTFLNVIGQTQICLRSATICCLRASTDKACSEGAKYALSNTECTLDNNGGNYVEKECCECCMLAINLLANGHNCTAGVGFNAACLNSFKRCCNDAINITQNIITTATHKEEHNVNPIKNLNVFDVDANLDNSSNFIADVRQLASNSSCDTAKCDHFCSISIDSNTTECACERGYDLDEDGHTCTDIDECLLLLDNCLESQRCFNTPGSYKCIRTLTCGTGYALDSETEQCVDVDECTLGAHDCGIQYQCRNTQGSYRCVPRICKTNEFMNLTTGNCVSINCPTGYIARLDNCEDIDECQLPNQCNAFYECINLPGAFRCQEKKNVCLTGFYLDRDSGFCLDQNECEDGTHNCNNALCINIPGTFKCQCNFGFEFNETSRTCEDINECERYTDSCSLQATCHNTVGSFTCQCNVGFELDADGRSCHDIDECKLNIAKCQQKCLNIPGSYQCTCDIGYQLTADELSCEDIDECTTLFKAEDSICIGECVNTPGGFYCICPDGFEVLSDNVTCKDINECTSLKIHPCSSSEVCVNTLGGYKCEAIDCPMYYERDERLKNRCVRKMDLCTDRISSFEYCRRMPLHISWQYIAIPRHVNISSQRTSVTLFSMKGPKDANSAMQFELQMTKAHPELPNVMPAIRENFLLQKGVHRNSAIVALRDSLDGPQTVQLELILRLSTNGRFAGTYTANLIIYVSKFRPQTIHIN